MSPYKSHRTVCTVSYFKCRRTRATEQCVQSVTLNVAVQEPQNSVYSQLLYTNFPNTREFCSLLQRSHVVPLCHQQLYSWRSHAICQETSNNSWPDSVCGKAPIHTASGLRASIVNSRGYLVELKYKLYRKSLHYWVTCFTEISWKSCNRITLDTKYCRAYTLFI